MKKEHEDPAVTKQVRKRKKSVAEVLFLILKEYANQLIFIGIPLLILILQIMQVWADTAYGRFLALLSKWCLIILLTGCVIQKLHQHFFPKKTSLGTQTEKEQKPQEAELQRTVVRTVPVETVSAVKKAKESATQIPMDMHIQGDVEVQRDLSIYGIVDGNIYCKGDIRLFGRVNGNLRCQNLYIDKAELEGDIQCNETVYLSPKSIVVGDIVAWRMLHKGYMKGNAYVRESVRMEKSSYLIGDVTSMEIEVEEGASIQGRMRIEAISDQVLQK